ncbi:hypothetical protein Mtc_0494 [Methanocella conradii HZ254]|uniref:Uncharacterized protein n=1 Tax=Methanocella conradii (strain DSM 24694 / JCM 17849 / CGMCC 1.5162 / HZ254) TaxID=1041930 RepID=H8I562_METCZ|nr:hypothetical protein [Methanocella conradii]AFC99259.1 hypothetical protein Mtc_0494 [Methanocella conradii HZ254]
MDIIDGLYSFFGTGDPAILSLDLLVAAVLAVSIAYLVLELCRIFAEYVGKEAAERPAEKPATVPPPTEAMKTPVQEPAKPPVKIPPIDVVKGSLAESMMTLTQKYGLDSLTLASHDGLVIASTSKAPDQDAAIYSGLYQELYKVKQEPYYYVESKGVSLYSVESGAQKVIGVAYRKGSFAPEEVKAAREDTKKVIDQFAALKAPKA